MRKIFYGISIGFAGCDEEGILEYSEDTTDEQINQDLNDMANEYASGWEGDERLYSDWDEDTTEAFYENVDAYWRDATEKDIRNYG